MNEDVADNAGGIDMRHQTDLVRKHCKDAERRIGSARSSGEAQDILTSICLTLDEECHSDIVKEFLRKYAQDLVKRYWSGAQ